MESHPWPMWEPQVLWEVPLPTYLEEMKTSLVLEGAKVLACNFQAWVPH
jgi:hypothetical protein